jgi:NAD-dependent dihydropyrimidine dehydrogenase PreA subunit
VIDAAQARRAPACPTLENRIVTIALNRTQAPVVVDESKCIAEKGCTVCVDVCPLDVLAIDLSKQKAFMKFDECWYCMPCEQDCPTGAVHVKIPYLVR